MSWELYDWKPNEYSWNELFKWFILNKLHRAQSSSKSDPASVNKFLRILWQQKFHRRVHKSRSLVPIPSHINPALKIPTSFFKIYINIIFPSAFRFSKLFLQFVPPTQNPWYLFFLTHFIWPANHVILDFIALVIFGREYRSWNPQLRSFLQCFLLRDFFLVEEWCILTLEHDNHPRVSFYMIKNDGWKTKMFQEMGMRKFSVKHELWTFHTCSLWGTLKF